MKLQKLSPMQKHSIRLSTKRINIWHGAVRSGKTLATVIRWINYISIAPEGDLAMLGKTERVLYRNVIRLMEDLLGSDFHYSRGKGEITVWGRLIFVIGMNDSKAEGKIRGMTCAGALGDEASLWSHAAFKMLTSRLSVEGSKLFVTTNPDSPYHWLKKEYIDRKNEIDIAVFHSTIDDNPHLSKEYVKELKQEYTGLWFKRFILGLWVSAEGVIYDFFDEKKHIISGPPAQAERYTIAIDYGTTNPSTFLLFGSHPRTEPTHWLEDEYYYDARSTGVQKTDEQYLQDLITFIGAKNISKIIIDPSAASFRTLLREHFAGTLIINADNTVINGIRLQSSALTKGVYKVCARCVNTIKEYYAYMWDEKEQARGVDAPRKEFDHTKDPERYFINDIYSEGIESEMTLLLKAMG